MVGAEVGAAFQRCFCSRHDPRMVVAKQQRAVPAKKVDILVAIDSPICVIQRTARHRYRTAWCTERRARSHSATDTRHRRHLLSARRAAPVGRDDRRLSQGCSRHGSIVHGSWKSSKEAPLCDPIKLLDRCDP